MKIAIATIFYNSVIEIIRLLDSIPKDVIDYFIAVDGIFKYTKEKYPELPELSHDGSRDTIVSRHIDDHKFVTVLIDKPNCTEFEKRNYYLEICEKLGDVDVLLIVDSDEYFQYDVGTIDPKECWQRFRKNLEFEIRKFGNHNVFGIPTYDCASGTKSYCPRIFVNPHEMRYLNNSHYHYGNITREAKDIEYFKSQGLNYVQHAAAIIKGLTLAHDHSLRSQEYQERRKDYQRYLVKFEELIQTYKYTSEQAHEIAKNQPKSDFEPTQ